MQLLWLDLETTGLDPVNGRILEVGAILTNGALEEVARLQTVVHHPLPTILPLMDTWCVDTHSKSGLLEEVIRASKDITEVEAALVAFIQPYCTDPKNKLRLAGNSVHFDRSFLAVHMPEFNKLLHYQHFDVSAVKLAFEVMMGKKLEKGNKQIAHRSIADLENAQSELRQLFTDLNYTNVRESTYGHQNTR